MIEDIAPFGRGAGAAGELSVDRVEHHEDEAGGDAEPVMAVPEQPEGERRRTARRPRSPCSGSGRPAPPSGSGETPGGATDRASARRSRPCTRRRKRRARPASGSAGSSGMTNGRSRLRSLAIAELGGLRVDRAPARRAPACRRSQRRRSRGRIAIRRQHAPAPAGRRASARSPGAPATRLQPRRVPGIIQAGEQRCRAPARRRRAHSKPALAASRQARVRASIPNSRAALAPDGHEQQRWGARHRLRA